MTTDGSETWLTTREVADLYGVAVKTVQDWLRVGRVRALRTPGGRYRVLRSDVERSLGDFRDLLGREVPNG